MTGRPFPEIEARGLDGRTYRLPGDLEDEWSVLEVVNRHGRIEWQGGGAFDEAQLAALTANLEG